MFITDTGRRAMQSLRHDPLDHHQLAADLCVPPWRARETLAALRRNQLVCENYEDGRRRRWELTDKGRALVHGADQLALDWDAGEKLSSR